MSANSFGKIFKITTFGESHNTAMGVIVEGMPSNVAIDETYIQRFLDERRPAQNPFTSPRKELDKIEILSGIYQNKTLGTPIAMLIKNNDQKSSDYENISLAHRPSHGDFTWQQKYSHVDRRGGGRSSARETVARVAGGALAHKILDLHNIKITGFLKSIGNQAISSDKIAAFMESINLDHNDPKEIFDNPFYSPDPNIVPLWQSMLEDAIKTGDSLGSIIEIRINNVPIGLGEPVFDKLNADLGKAIFSIPGVKGLEFGDGFELTTRKGSETNDQMYIEDNKPRFFSNHSAGIQGGISNGEEIILKIAIKPTSSIKIEQKTITTNLENTTLEVKGRHDPCIGIRAVSVCKAMCSIVLADHILRNKISQI